MTAEIAVTEEAPQLIAFPEYTGIESWDELAATSLTAPGADLLKGNALVGVPFVITSATFRPGDYKSPKTGQTPHYVSLEIVAGSEALFARALKRGRISESCDVEPLERLVFNEAGTGAYRQIVGAFEGWGWVTLPDGPTEGAFGESRLDTPVDDWEITEAGTAAGLVVTFTSEERPVIRASLRILCERGLRKSEYQNDFTKEGVTRYLA